MISPITRGLMLDQGYVLRLDPDRYPKHAELAKKLRRPNSGWQERDPSGNLKPRQDPETVVDEIRVVLPHQAEAIEKIRKNIQEHGARS